MLLRILCILGVALFSIMGFARASHLYVDPEWHYAVVGAWGMITLWVLSPWDTDKNA